ncbi:DUF742 domain-containing protein [Streptomyces sp. RFCAC02]|uniref:DUF742 domain-containing protein n=1 Tax=Streptomyces sp. RFCAC02 TaxID=2499143 RepID=UPI001021618D|nr:DUF742 domain-containing protein [Streptomyces sp. RFCAC02]
MTAPGRDEDDDPARLFTLTGGRAKASGAAAALDLITLVSSVAEPVAGMPSEHAAVLRLCRRPTSVAEIAAHIRVPIGLVRIMLSDLLDNGAITIRPPRTAMAADSDTLPDSALLRQVLVGLRDL